MRPGSPLLRLALVAAVTVAMGASACPAVAAPASSDACATVHVGPDQGAGAASGYFDETLQPGHTRHLRLLVANPASVACTVSLLPATGRTATNSGDTYVATPVGTWVQGLQQRIALPAGGRRLVPFDVVVPDDAAPGQRLYGVLGAPAVASSAAPRDGVQLHVTTRVAIGVAVTVPGAMRSAVTIPEVTSRIVGPDVQLDVHERNDGVTWEHPHGSIVVRTSQRTLRIPVRSNTVLPDGEAVLVVAASDVPGGSWPVQVRLVYDRSRVATWSGTLDFSPPQVARDGDVLTITSAPPTWMYIALGVAAALLALALVAVVVLWRRRVRPRPAA